MEAPSPGPLGIAALNNTCCIICRASSRYECGRILQGELNSVLRSEHVPWVFVVSVSWLSGKLPAGHGWRLLLHQKWDCTVQN